MFRIGSGPLLNLVGRGKPYGATPTAALVSPSRGEDASYPLANLYNGRPATPFRFASRGADYPIDLSTNLLPNGDMEQGTTGWTASNATVTSETGAGNYYKGAKSLKIVTTSAGGGAKGTDVTVQAGQYMQLWAAAKSDGTNAARVRVQCLETGLDLNSSGAWVAATAYACSKTTATMAAFTPVSFQVPSLTSLGRPTATLRVTVSGAANGQTAYFDEVLLVVGFNFVGWFGHGFLPGSDLVVTKWADYWHGGASSGLTTSTETLSVLPVAHATFAAMQYEPLVRAQVSNPGAISTDAALAIPWIGELVVAQVPELARNPDYPFTIEYREPSARMSTANGAQWVLPRGSYPTRRVTMSFAYASDAQYQEARDALYTMSRGGAYPIVLVPTETDSGEAIYGRLEDVVTFRRDSFAQRMAEFIVVEEPFPWM